MERERLEAGVHEVLGTQKTPEREEVFFEQESLSHPFVVPSFPQFLLLSLLLLP